MAVYMIRASGFGREYSEKLYMVLIILAMMLFDSYEKDRQSKKGNKAVAAANTTTPTSRTSEYWFILLVGSLWWAILEGIIARLGTRNITSGTLFGHPIPFWASSLLRGSAEGGSVAVGSIFFSDRMFAPTSSSYYSWYWHLIYFTLLLFCCWAQYQGQEPEMLVGSTEIASRRNMFTPLSIVYGGFVISAVIWYAHHLKRFFPKAFVRQWRAFCVMEFFALVWSIAQFHHNLRWIEVDNNNNSNTNDEVMTDEDTTSTQWVRASPFIEIAAFLYDIVAEIGVFYIPFYAIPWYYKALQDEHPLYGSDTSGNKNESKKQ